MPRSRPRPVYPYHLHGVPPSDASMVHGTGVWTFRATRAGAAEEISREHHAGLLRSEVIRWAWDLPWTLPGGPERIEIIRTPHS
jgi:hypothetical protein